MSKIFDLDKPEFGVYENALKTAEVSPSDNDLRAIAINLRHDHRVSEAREQEFREYFERSGDDLQIALSDYFYEKVYKSNNPNFCEPCIADFSGGSCKSLAGFDENMQLASVLTFHKLRDRIRSLDSISIVSDLWDTGLVEARNDSVKFSKWLDEHLLDSSGVMKDPQSAEVKKFIADFFEIANCNLKDAAGNYDEYTRIKPFWATDWSKFDPYTKYETDRWNQVVGVWREYSTWQIIITYPASAVDILYRPTQLDGGFYPQHFPPPREIGSAEGGYTMDWGTPDVVLLPEFIHGQIELKYEYWESAGYRIGKTGLLVCDLPRSRSDHYEKLKGSFDEHALKNWMPIPF